MHKWLKVFFVYTICLAILSLLGITTLYVLKKTTYYYFSIKVYTIIEFSLLSLTFSLLIKSTLVKRFLILFIPFFAIFSILHFSNGYIGFSSYPSLLEFFWFIIILIFYFFETLNTVSTVPVYNKISFWIAVGLFFYFTGNFFYILLVENSRNESIEVKNQLIIMYSIVTVVKNIILGMALMLGKEDDDNSNNFIPFPSDLDLDATPNL